MWTPSTPKRATAPGHFLQQKKTGLTLLAFDEHEIARAQEFSWSVVTLSRVGAVRRPAMLALHHLTPFPCSHMHRKPCSRDLNA